MPKDVAKETQNELKKSLEAVKDAAWSLGMINFPEINTIKKNFERASKHNSPKIAKEILKPYRKKLEPYFYPHLFFDNKMCSFSAEREQQKNNSERKLHREDTRIENSYKRVLEMPLRSETSRKEAKSVLDKEGLATKRLEERRGKLKASYNECKLPSSEEIKSNERNDFTPETMSYYRQLLNNSTLLTAYRYYWENLCEDIFTDDPIDISLYIKISSYWRRDKLQVLYSLLTDSGYIESGKEAPFLAIFLGFNYDYSDQLPIKWLCKSNSTGSDMSSNLTMLYYLVSALKDWEAFQVFLEGKHKSEVKEFLISSEKKLMANYFIHGNGEKIMSTSLVIHNNKNCGIKIKELFSHFANTP